MNTSIPRWYYCWHVIDSHIQINQTYTNKWFDRSDKINKINIRLFPRYFQISNQFDYFYFICATRISREIILIAGDVNRATMKSFTRGFEVCTIVESISGSNPRDSILCRSRFFGKRAKERIRRPTPSLSLLQLDLPTRLSKTFCRFSTRFESGTLRKPGHPWYD